jgi:hypothetical protein
MTDAYLIWKQLEEEFGNDVANIIYKKTDRDWCSGDDANSPLFDKLRKDAVHEKLYTKIWERFVRDTEGLEPNDPAASKHILTYAHLLTCFPTIWPDDMYECSQYQKNRVVALLCNPVFRDAFHTIKIHEQTMRDILTREYDGNPFRLASDQLGVYVLPFKHEVTFDLRFAQFARAGILDEEYCKNIFRCMTRNQMCQMYTHISEANWV